MKRIYVKKRLRPQTDFQLKKRCDNCQKLVDINIDLEEDWEMTAFIRCPHCKKKVFKEEKSIYDNLISKEQEYGNKSKKEQFKQHPEEREIIKRKTRRRIDFKD